MTEVWLRDTTDTKALGAASGLDIMQFTGIILSQTRRGLLLEEDAAITNYRGNSVFLVGRVATQHIKKNTNFLPCLAIQSLLQGEEFMNKWLHLATQHFFWLSTKAELYFTEMKNFRKL